MSMTMDEPAPPGFPLWLEVGARVLDTGRQQVGVLRLFRDDVGEISAAHPIPRPTRVLLRPVGQGLPWWADVADLDQPPEAAQ